MRKNRAGTGGAGSLELGQEVGERGSTKKISATEAGMCMKTNRNRSHCPRENRIFLHDYTLSGEICACCNDKRVTSCT